jgi:hypothetical protein
LDLELFFRRKTMLKLFYSGSLNAKSIRGLADLYKVSEQTIRQDWKHRSEWEPLIWAMNDCKNDPVKILRKFQYAQEQALKLMGNADQDSVKVAAIGRYNESIQLEFELSQSAGMLPKVSVVPQINLGVDVSVQNRISVNGTPELSEYERIVKRMQMDNISKTCSSE